MNAANATPQQQPHPAPHRDRLSLAAAWFAILAAPVAWSVQLLVNAPLVAHACYPHDEPLATPALSHLLAAAGWVEGLALALCLAGGAMALRNWRRTRNERPGTAHHLIEGGDGRSRFMAMAGLLTSSLFLIGVIFAAFNLTLAVPCR
jgi:hypothetical protein